MGPVMLSFFFQAFIALSMSERPPSEDDCGTVEGFTMKALIEGGEVIEPLRDRILGRVAANDVINPEDGSILIKATGLLDEEAVDRIEELGVDEVKVRTPLTCETRYGLCSKCYGRDLGRGTPVLLSTFISSVERFCGRKAIINRMPMQPGDVPRTSCDTSKAKELLGYEATVSLEEGLSNTVAWYQKYHQNA